MLTISEKDLYKSFFAAHIMITSRCNLCCYYCYYPAKPGPEPTLEQIDCILCEFESLGEPGIFYEVSGGEPMLRADWDAVMERFLATGRDVVLNTNGTLIDDQNISKLISLHDKYGKQLYLSVSIDSHDPAIHNRTRGLYPNVIAGLTRLRDSGIPFRTSTTLTRHNVKTLTETVRFVIDHFTREVFVGILRPVFPMTKENQASLLSLDEIRQAYLHVEAFTKERDFIFYHCLGEDGEPGCLAGIDRLAIGCNGEIYPCYALQHIVLGNVFSDGLHNPRQTFCEKVKDKPIRDLLCNHPCPSFPSPPISVQNLH